MEKISDEAEVVKPAEEVETSKTITETTEKTETTSDTEVEKVEEENPYKKELERVKADAAKKDDLIRKKDGALKQERERRKQAEALIPEDDEEEVEVKPRRKYLTPEEADERFEEKLRERDFGQIISQVASDPDEQALIKHHYDNSIVRTGNVAADIKKAVAIANAHLVEQAKRAQTEREETESFVTGFQIGRPTGRSGKPSHQTDPVLRAAATILDNLGVGEAKKHLGK